MAPPPTKITEFSEKLEKVPSAPSSRQLTQSEVYLSSFSRSGRHVALKKMKLKKFEEGLPKDVIRELEALRLLKSAELDSEEDSHIISLF